MSSTQVLNGATLSLETGDEGGGDGTISCTNVCRAS